MKFLVLLILLVSCAPNMDKFKSADFGSAENYQERITKILKRSLKNPDSLVIKKMSEPKKTFVQNMNPSALWNPYFPALGVCVEYEAKNIFGGSVFKKVNFFIINKEIKAEATTQNQYLPCLMF